MIITKEYFIKATGFSPDQDDLERSNCLQAGKLCHSQCGWNTEKNLPVFIAGSEERVKGATIC